MPLGPDFHSIPQKTHSRFTIGPQLSASSKLEFVKKVAMGNAGWGLHDVQSLKSDEGTVVAYIESSSDVTPAL